MYYRYDITIFSIGGSGLGIIAWFTINSITAIGYMLTGIFSGISLFSIRRMRLRAALQSSVNVLKEENDELKENKVFFVPDAKQNKKQSVSHDLIIEEWEGLIKNIDEDCFKADLCKKNSNVSESIVADFSISDVPEDEQHLVKPGMIFYWYIRKEVKKSGTISNGESLMFRRMPSWKHFDLNKKTTKSDEFFNFLSTESSE